MKMHVTLDHASATVSCQKLLNYHEVRHFCGVLIFCASWYIFRFDDHLSAILMVLDLIKCLIRHICEILLLVLNCKVAIAQTCEIKATMKISDL